MQHINNLRIKFKIAKIAFYSLASLIVLFGLSSYFWPKTQGEIIWRDFENHMNGIMSFPANGYGGRFGGSFSWQNVKYTFKKDNATITGRLICICLPLGLKVPETNKSVLVSYFPLIPEISVLYTGPFFLFSGVLVLFGGFAQIIEGILNSENGAVT